MSKRLQLPFPPSRALSLSFLPSLFSLCALLLVNAGCGSSFWASRLDGLSTRRAPAARGREAGVKVRERRRRGAQERRRAQRSRGRKRPDKRQLATAVEREGEKGGREAKMEREREEKKRRRTMETRERERATSDVHRENGIERRAKGGERRGRALRSCSGGGREERRAKRRESEQWAPLPRVQCSEEARKEDSEGKTGGRRHAQRAAPLGDTYVGGECVGRRAGGQRGRGGGRRANGGEKGGRRGEEKSSKPNYPIHLSLALPLFLSSPPHIHTHAHTPNRAYIARCAVYHALARCWVSR